MADTILKFLTNLLKIGKEQLLLKSVFLRNKVPIKPVLGLTSLGILIMAVRPFLKSKEPSVRQTETKTSSSILDKKQQEAENEYSLQKTLYLMREKEKLLRKQEAKQLQQ